jgi:intracellular sulfur oxidation DsrE/DsrF family protein
MKKLTKLIMVFAFALTMFAAAPQSVIAEMKAHKVAIHVDEADPKKLNMALNNVANVRKYYDAKGEKVIIEVVAYGPGLHMLRADTSPVADRIAKMSLEIDNLQFSACGNTHRVMSKKAGKKIELISEATMVPSGVVQLIALQEDGYSYVRP